MALKHLKHLVVLFFLLPSFAFAQSPPPVDLSRGCKYWYPPKLQRMGVRGTTVISFRILVSGLVDDLSVVESSGSIGLDRAALHCASNWKYKPATHGGQPIEVTQTAKIVWQLDDGTAPTAPPAADNHP